MKKVIVYSTRNCPYCVAAKTLLNQLQVHFEEIFLDHQPELWSQLSSQNNGWRTVPMIFVGDEFLGGFTDIKSLHDSGLLLPKIYSPC
jgi:glutaredoxin 3